MIYAPRIFEPLRIRIVLTGNPIDLQVIRRRVVSDV